jgi:membrane protein involved in D-alanine export
MGYSAIAYSFFSYFFIKYLSLKINHKLASSIILLIPMLFFKLKLDIPILYFIGLSFVTFRAIQTNIDFNKKEDFKFIDFFNFLFFIPALLIGPLDRFKDFTQKCKNGFNTINLSNLESGFSEFLKGLLYKYVIAEFIYRYWLNDFVFEKDTASYFLSDMYAYLFYLFFDFAGYSALACGFSKMIGISLPFNFNMPFLAVNPPEFWQRWHASLTNWLTDYVFKPTYKWLSGFQQLKKYPITKQNLAIFLTLFIMGCWNGFEPQYIYSGLIYALYSIVHNSYTMQCRKKQRDILFGTIGIKYTRYVSIFLLFNFTAFALYVFSGRCF